MHHGPECHTRPGHRRESLRGGELRAAEGYLDPGSVRVQNRIHCQCFQECRSFPLNTAGLWRRVGKGDRYLERRRSLDRQREQVNVFLG